METNRGDAKRGLNRDGRLAQVRVYQDSREIWFQTAPWTVPWFQEIPTMTRRHIPSWKAWALAFVVVNVAACVMWKLERGRPDASEDRSFY